MTTRAGGTVAVVDTARWSGFDQMAGALRRRGVRVVRITHEHSVVARAIDRLAYDASHGFDTDDRLHEILDGLDRDDLLDVMVVDDLVQEVAAHPWRHAPAHVVERLRRRALWSDKLWASRTMREAGVPVPATVPAASGVRQAVEALGLPVVVKNHVGAGGAGVRIVHDLDEATAAVTVLAADPARPDDVFLEEFVAGETLCYGATFVEGEVRQEVCYRSRRDPANPTGPSTQVEVIDDPELLAVGRRLVAAVGGSGIVNADVVADGPRRLVVDVNLRVWGSAMMLHGAGVSFDDGYLEAVTGGREPVYPARVGTVLRAFPDSQIHAITTTGVLPARDMARAALPYLRVSGARYVTSACLYALRLWTVRRGLGRPSARDA